MIIFLLQQQDERIRDRIFDYLWWDDVNSFAYLNKAAFGITKEGSFGASLFARQVSRMYRYKDGMQKEEFTAFSEGEGGATWPLLARRLPSWPTGIDIASFVQEPRNVSVIPSKQQNSLNGDFCVVYGGRKKESHKGFTVVVTDDHFPCLPGTFTAPRHKNEGKMQVRGQLDFRYRAIALP